MRLHDIAHARAGDKGDTAQICVFAYDKANYPLLVNGLTADRVIAHFPGLKIRSVSRYELPLLGALNFVLEGALFGGVTRSLALDAHGKSLGAQLLSMEIGNG